MKKLTAIILTLAMALTLAACGGQPAVSSPSPGGTPTPAPDSPSPVHVTPAGGNDATPDVSSHDTPDGEGNTDISDISAETSPDQVLLDSITVTMISKNVCPFADAYMAGYGFLPDAAEKATVFTLMLEGGGNIANLLSYTAKFDLKDDGGESVPNRCHKYGTSQENRYLLLMRVLNDADVGEFSLVIEKGDASRAVALSGEVTPMDPALVKTGEAAYGDFVQMDGAVFMITGGGGFSSSLDSCSFMVSFVPLDSVMTHKADYDQFSFRANENSDIKDKVATVSINASAPSEREISSSSLQPYNVIVKIEHNLTSEGNLLTDSLRALYYLEYTGDTAFSLLP